MELEMQYSVKHDLKSLNQKELENLFVALGEKPFRARQVYHWMHVRHAASFDEMSNISKSLKEKLKECCELTVLRQKLVQRSKIDGTAKYLFELADGNMIESVRMKYKHGNSVCISSQAGCRMPFLRVHFGRSCAQFNSGRNVGSNLSDSGGYRRAGFPCGRDGNWGAFGQL